MDSTRELLDAAYADLGLRDGALLDAVEEPESGSAEDWIDRGEWLSLASSVGVEKVFFVENNPVIVFASSDEGDDRQTRETINRIWCMARPQCLFFARPGDLSVFDLTRPPIGSTEAISDQQRILRTVRRTVEVQSELADFRRELVESGAPAEGQGYFSAGEARADKALIEDLRKVRKELLNAGLSGDKEKYANALIGRAIFIRYLEDRRILLPSDFQDVAAGDSDWLRLLNADQGVPIEPSMEHVNFTKVLGNKEFTYAFFDRIAGDFNGDLFPVTREEKQAVTGPHLRLLQRFLRGEIADDIPRLFFFAYRFEVIPIELISSIYEAFYNAEKGTDQNQEAHYTPIELVEYLLSKTLPRDILEKNPCILDPACGSGIFLVEAFRRIVRFRQAKNRRKLSLAELKKIIRDQLRGIDINGEAVRVAAFSLYLALLHHVKPPDIWRDKRLPNLKYALDADSDEQNRFDILFEANCFDLQEAITHTAARRKLASKTMDVVVGNPPWGYPSKKDQKGIEAALRAEAWCKAQEFDIGDKELSQAFIHRTVDLLRDGGKAGLLVSTGVFFKHHPKSRAFRRHWLKTCCLQHVVNFAAVRDLFFQKSQESKAIAPFASVVFNKQEHWGASHVFEYWCAKRTLQVERLNAVVLGLADRRIVSQQQVYSDDTLWKIYWWGNHNDHALVSALMLETTLSSIVGSDTDSERRFGRGFESGGKDTPPDWMAKLNVLPPENFRRYGPLVTQDFLPPATCFRSRGGLPPRDVFEGTRLLVKRGISQSGGDKGIIVARLEEKEKPFSFRNSIHGVSLGSLPQWKAKVVLGILWSSLARYFFWLTASEWGTWHHNLHQEDIKRLPIRFPEDKATRERLIRIVEQLRENRVVPRGMLLNEQGTMGGLPASQVSKLEQDLDDCVFDAYDLSPPERDLIRDMCSVGLDLFYRHSHSQAVRRLSIPNDFGCGLISDIENGRTENDLIAYLKSLLRSWNDELHPHGQFSWHVIRPDLFSPMIAVVLATRSTDDQQPVATAADRLEWSTLMRRLDETCLQHDGSRRVYIDGVVRAVGENEVIIIKRNERRLWTASMAREDAEATIKQAMELQEQQ